MADRSYTTCLLFRAGAVLACFIALMMAVPAIGLLFGVPVMGWMVPFAFALAVLLVALASESGTPRCTLRAGLIALVAVVLATVACGCVLDLSYDGNTHHKQAVAFLAQGWNPLGGSVAGFSAFQELYPSGDAIQLWIDHYARGPWLYGAALYDLTGWIEAGKSYTLVSMLAAGIMLGAFLARRGFAGWQCALVALLAVVNPITVPQMITYYNDAVLMMCLLLMLLCLYITALDNAEDVTDASMRRISLLVFACSFIACAQVKFSGLAYAGLFSLAFLVVYGAQAAMLRGRAVRRFVGVGLLMVAAVGLSVLVVGFSPYVTNLIGFGNPFYPLSGADAVDIMAHNTPAGFESMSVLEREFAALFSQMLPLGQDAVSETETTLKVPFSLQLDELRYLRAPDARISGFGVLYSGIALVSITLVVPMLVASRKRWPVFFACCVAYYASVVALAVIFTDSWWARYSSYRYFSSIILLAFLFKLWNPSGANASAQTGSNSATQHAQAPVPRFVENHPMAIRTVTAIFALLLALNTTFYLALNTCVQYARSCVTYGQLLDLSHLIEETGDPLRLYAQTPEIGLIFDLNDLGISYAYEGPAPDTLTPEGELHRFLYTQDSTLPSRPTDLSRRDQ